MEIVAGKMVGFRRLVCSTERGRLLSLNLPGFGGQIFDQQTLHFSFQNENKQINHGLGFGTAGFNSIECTGAG